MKRKILLGLLIIPLLYSCEKVKEWVPVWKESKEDSSAHTVMLSDSLVADSLSKRAAAIASDSVRLVVEFSDASGKPLSKAIPITFIDDAQSVVLTTDETGTIQHMVKSDHVVTLMYGEDEVMNYFDMKGGEELNDHIRLNILPMRGRIMDNNGVPHQKMPLHIHYRYNKKDRSLGCANDLVVYTDTLGYYKTYVTTDFHSMVLRSCGFVFGVVPKREFTEFPVQNFLFDPFDVENRCAYNVPRHEYIVQIPFSEGYSEDVPLHDWSRLFAMDEALEASETIKVKLSFPTKSYTYKLKKKGGAFREQVFRVCLR